MTKNLHKLCIVAGLIMMGLFTACVLMARLFPPPSPLESAQVVVDQYVAHLTRTRVGLIIGGFGCAFMALFIAAVAWETRKMTGRQSIASYVQLVTATLFLASIYFPLFIFMVTTFRLERPVQITQALNDLAWLIFVPAVSMSVLWLLFLGLAMLRDARAVPTFPRWFAYYTLFSGVDFGGGAFAVLTKEGPFAWNGVISFYIPFATLGLWYLGMTIFMLRAVDREYATVTTVFAEMPTEERVDALSADFDIMRAELARLSDRLTVSRES